MKIELTTIKTFTSDENVVDIDVQSECDSADRLVVALLMVVEKLTGVSTDSYIEEVDARRVSP